MSKVEINKEQLDEVIKFLDNLMVPIRASEVVGISNILKQAKEKNEQPKK